jgi:hypothetical protein
VITDFFGDDKELVNLIKSCLQQGTKLCEVFNHGTDAKTILDDSKTVADIQALIKKSDSTIKAKLNFKARTFVPHENRWGNNLVKALRNEYYNVLSSSLNEGMTFDMKSDPIRMPQQTETADYDAAGKWVGKTTDSIVKDCTDSISSGDAACVIMMHAHEFDAGTYTMANLADLINTLKNKGWESTTFADFAWPLLPTRPTDPPLPKRDPKTKYFILRVDDIQDYYVKAQQQQIIQWCM